MSDDSLSLGLTITLLIEACEYKYWKEWPDIKKKTYDEELLPHHKKHKTKNCLTSALEIIKAEKDTLPEAEAAERVRILIASSI